MRRFAVLLFVSIPLAMSAGQAADLYVDGDVGADGGDCQNAGTPCGTIAYAIDQADTGDEIRIAPGRYVETLSITKSLSLLGGGYEEAEIVGHEEFFGQAPRRVLTIAAGIDVTVAGLGIGLGYAQGAGSEQHGGGLYAGPGANVRLRDVAMAFNKADGDGGALYLAGGATANLDNVQIVFNRAEGNGGGLYCDGGDSVLTDVSIVVNEAGSDGAGMYNDGGAPTLKNVQFIQNRAEHDGGGMANIDSAPELVNVLFQQNAAIEEDVGSGGAMVNYDSAPVLVNATVSGNGAYTGGGLMNYGTSTVTLSNAIFWGNNVDEGGLGGNDIYSVPAASVEAYYSIFRYLSNDIIGGFDCDDCLVDDPDFVNPPGPFTGDPDLRLKTGSPAIDAGDPAIDLSRFPGGPATPRDLDGNPRVSSGRIDIGAYEWSDMLFLDRFEQ